MLTRVCTALMLLSPLAMAQNNITSAAAIEEDILEEAEVQAVPVPREQALSTLEETVAAFSVRPPDESSPFFAERELARMERRQNAREEIQGATGPDDTALYPSTNSSNSAASTLSRFFTEMFSSISFGDEKGKSGPATLKIEPEPLSLSDRREMDVTFVITNPTKRIQRIDYPTTQRIEIITTDSSGQVVERWSDDRSFQPEDGIVFINPGERIQYWEKVPTRDLKPGETYEVSAEVANSPDLSATAPLIPEP